MATKNSQVEMRKILQGLVKKEANLQCADCTAQSNFFFKILKKFPESQKS